MSLIIKVKHQSNAVAAVGKQQIDSCFYNTKFRFNITSSDYITPSLDYITPSSDYIIENSCKIHNTKSGFNIKIRYKGYILS
jgi:hypothetical protein